MEIVREWLLVKKNEKWLIKMRKRVIEREEIDEALDFGFYFLESNGNGADLTISSGPKGKREMTERGSDIERSSSNCDIQDRQQENVGWQVYLV